MFCVNQIFINPDGLAAFALKDDTTHPFNVRYVFGVHRELS